uniref:Claudin n=1 Tax=Branchiostoma floridae TaxID=7739 RepID=C3Z7N2_BRAFL|eukprot:XP_002595375.1 hypothetical protein BRAFLDRAFT_69204 [Branchiostoma floridae]
MGHLRLPHRILYGQLADGKRDRGRPKQTVQTMQEQSRTSCRLQSPLELNVRQNVKEQEDSSLPSYSWSTYSEELYTTWRVDHVVTPLCAAAADFVFGCAETSAPVGVAGTASLHTRMAQCGKRPLMLVTTVCSTASFALLAIAMGTDFWLFSQEAMFTPRPNGTVKLAANSGLWNECIRRQGSLPSYSWSTYSEELYTTWRVDHVVTPLCAAAADFVFGCAETSAPVGVAGTASLHTRMAQCGKRPLMLVTTVCSTASFALLAIAMGTDFWLFSQEAMFTPRPNGTVKLAANSGLWNECIRRQGLWLLGQVDVLRQVGGVAICVIDSDPGI